MLFTSRPPSSPAALLALAFLPACIAFDQHLAGPALWPFIFSAAPADPDDPVLAGAAGVSVFVPAAEVGPDPFDPSLVPLSGGALTLSGPGLDGPAPLIEGVPGVYGSGGVDPIYEPGAVYEVQGAFGELVVRTAAPAVAGLRIPAPTEPLAPGQDLRLPMPSGYADLYDQVIVTVTSESGELTYDNTPPDAEAWLRFASGQYTPAPLVVPHTAFPTRGALYAVKIVGLIRARSGADRSTELRSELSGFTTGSGVVVPVWTAP